VNIVKVWRAWRAYEEVKSMNKKGLIQLGLAVVAALAVSAGAQLGTGDAVSWTDLGTVALTTVFAYLKSAPDIFKK